MWCFRYAHFTFQSTLPRRERLIPSHSYTCSESFQSTLPRRERLGFTDIFVHTINFNPRSHEGSDADPNNFAFVAAVISIHAPTKGATAFLNFDNPVIVNFNPRSHEGSDIPVKNITAYPTDFNPRSHEGSDRKMVPIFKSGGNFNPRSHEGSDCMDLISSIMSQDFNPRSHEGSD